MTKSELIQTVANDFPTANQNLVADIFNSSLELIKQTLCRGGHVRLSNFGTFNVVEHAARTGRNPRTGEPIEIPAHNVVHFKPVSKFRDAINGGIDHD